MLYKAPAWCGPRYMKRNDEMRAPRRIASISGALALAGLLSACAYQDPYGGGYPPPPPQPTAGYGGGYQQPDQNVAEYGVLRNIEAQPRTYQRGSTSGVGAVLGAVVGGVLGNQIGGGLGRAAATAAGAVGGAYAGNALEGRTAPSGEVGGLYRLIIQLDRGGERIYDVPDPGDLRPGDRVRMVNGQISRY